MTIKWLLRVFLPIHSIFGIDDAALVLGGASALGGIIGANAASDAADAQTQSADRAIGEQARQFDLTRSDTAPYRALGSGAVSLLGTHLGVAGSAIDENDPRFQAIKQSLIDAADKSHQAQYGMSIFDARSGLQAPGQRSQFDENINNSARQQYIAQFGDPTKSAPGAGDLLRDFSSADLENDPIYQKALQWATTQGTQAINRAAAARGGIDSGSTLKGIVDYALGSASQYGNDAFNRFNVSKGNIFNRLAGASGLGQTSIAQANAAGANMANNVSDLITGSGNARAASIVGGTNAITGAANNIANYYTGQQTLDKVLRAGGGYNPYALYSSPVANASIASQLPG